MLPGFRFAVATILLTVSVLIFGLGAAALLRASYDRFVDLPSAQLPHEPTFARDQRTRQTTLALLRVEMAEQTDAKAPPPVTVESTAVVAASEPEPPASPVVTPPVVAPSVVTPSPSATVSEDVVAKTPQEERGSEASPAETPAVTAKAEDGIQLASTEVAVAEPPAEAAADRPPEPAVCIPTSLLGMGGQVALLVDPSQPHPEIAVKGSRTKAAKASRSNKPAVHRARHARLRHAPPRRHRAARRAPVIAAPVISAPPLGSSPQQAQSDPFLGFRR